MEFGKQLAKYREENQIDQKDIAKLLEITPQTVSNYETGKNKIPYEKLIMLCNYYKKNPLDFIKADLNFDLEEIKQDEQKILSSYKNLTDSDRRVVDFVLGIGEYDIKNNPIEKELQKIYILPVYQQDVAAGSGQLGFDQKHEMEEFCEENMPNKISYGIKIKGTSMETDDEKNIPDKSTILVTTELDYNELVGEAVIVNINGTLVCKVYNIAEDGHLWLKSRNRNKSNEDKHIYDLDGVKIIGKVAKVIL